MTRLTQCLRPHQSQASRQHWQEQPERQQLESLKEPGQQPGQLGKQQEQPGQQPGQPGQQPGQPGQQQVQQGQQAATRPQAQQ